MTIDLDANASYAPSEELRQVIFDSWKFLGNPSALHRVGQRARAAIEEARESIRQLVGATSRDTVIFTSGATEANNMLIRACGSRDGRLLSSQIEHPCVLAPLQNLKDHGKDVNLVAPTPDGVISAESIMANLTPETSLVSVMTANNETGVINDIRRIVTQARSAAPDTLIHTDASQIIGKGDFSMREVGVDALTISGHKFGALTGVGALVVRHGMDLTPLLLGGPQEGKLRGGTENVLGVLSLGKAANAVMKECVERINQMRAIRDAFENTVCQAIEECEVNGATVERLPNTCSLFIAGVRGDDVVVALDLEGILVSSGAACSSGKPDPSHVLLAMGQSEDRVRSTIRVSFRGDQDASMVELVVERLKRIVNRMRNNKEGVCR